MIDALSLIRGWWVDDASPIGERVYRRRLPKTFNPEDGAGVVIWVEGGVSHKEISALQNVRLKVRVWAKSAEDAMTKYRDIYTWAHGKNNLGFGDAGFLLSSVEADYPQNVTDIESGWETVLATYALILRDGDFTDLSESFAAGSQTQAYIDAGDAATLAAAEAYTDEHAGGVDAAYVDAAVTAEAAIRAAADGGFTSLIGGVEADLATEVQHRIDGDTAIYFYKAGSNVVPTYDLTEQPVGMNPCAYVEDNSNGLHFLAGIDTLTASPQNGRLTFVQGLNFRDTLSDAQTGKNAFISINHTSVGNSALPTIQDRCIWIGMANVTGAIQSFSISGNITTLVVAPVSTNRYEGYRKNMQVIPAGLSTGTYLNSVVLTVLTATKPSAATGGTQTLTCSGLTHADVATTSDAGRLDQKLYSMAGIQMQVDIWGAPTFQAGNDTEIKPLSVQVSDNHLGNISQGGGVGAGNIRAQYFRESGAGCWTSPTSVVLGIYTNTSLQAGNSQAVYVFNGKATELGPADGTMSIPVSIFHATAPSPRFKFNKGFECDNFGTNASDFNFFSAGVNSAGTAAGFNTFQGPSAFGVATQATSGYQVDVTGKVRIKGAAAGAFIDFIGSTSGTAGIGVAAAAGTPSPLLLPNSTGGANNVLKTDGNGTAQQLSWVSLATVATSGLYSDLSGTPTLAVTDSGATHNFLTSYNSATGAFTHAQPAFSDISGTVAAAQLPNPSASTLGGVKSLASASHQFLTQIGTDGSVSQAQPAFSDISGSLDLTSQVGSSILPPANGGVGNETTAGGGGFFFSTGITSRTMVDVAMTTQVISGTANVPHASLFYLPIRITIRKVCWAPSTQGGAGKVAVLGLYSEDGTTKKLEASFDANGSTTVPQSVTLGSSVTLAPGYYFFVMASDSTSTASNIFASSSAITGAMLNKNVSRHGTTANSMAAGSLPSSLGAITGDNKGVQLALFEA